jgi:hypothetical protein
VFAGDLRDVVDAAEPFDDCFRWVEMIVRHVAILR